MRAIGQNLQLPQHVFPTVGHPGDVIAANGTYRCLCCGVVLWHVLKGRRFPDCPSNNCPTMWLWSER
jgi:hypothetical protein